MLPDIVSWEIKLENILPMRVFAWLVILFGCKIYGIKELEPSESKKSFVGWWSLCFKSFILKSPTRKFLFLFFGYNFKNLTKIVIFKI